MAHLVDVIDGIPVLYDQAGEYLAEARGIWPFKRIRVGRQFYALGHYERLAVLMHEVGHCRGLHFEIRLLLLPFFWTRFAARVARKQELDCDLHAAKHGLAVYMLRAIAAGIPDQGPFYPSPHERCAALQAFAERSIHAVT